MRDHSQDQQLDAATVAILLAQSERKVDDQISRANALDAKAAAVMASSALVAQQLPQTAGLFEASLLACLAITFLLGLLGIMVIPLRHDPDPVSFAHDHLNDDPLRVRLQLIANLNDSYQVNGRRICRKARAIQIAIPLLALTVIGWVSLSVR